MKHRIVTVAAVFLLLSGLMATVSLYQLYYFSNAPMLASVQSFKYELLPGTSLTEMANDLQTQNVLKSPQRFIWMVRLRGDAGRLQSGEYYFPAGTTPLQLLHKIKKGRAIHHRITFAEGVRFADIRASLSDNLSLKHVLASLSEDEIGQALGINNKALEGLFYPDTYAFYKNTEDKTILLKAYKKMQQVLHDEWQDRMDSQLYATSYDALIAASLVEKETANDNERFKVATVIANRLQKGMRLQIDPTVIYGMGDSYPGKLLRSHLKFPSPYNTYLHKGLPPSPIAIPSRASIHATLHPLKNKNLYYVSKGDGTHLFSNTLAEHQQNIVKVKAQIEKGKDDG